MSEYESKEHDNILEMREEALLGNSFCCWQQAIIMYYDRMLLNMRTEAMFGISYELTL